MNKSSEGKASPARSIRMPKFSLKLMLLAITFAAILLAAWASKIEPYRRQFAGFSRWGELVSNYLQSLNDGTAATDLGFNSYLQPAYIGEKSFNKTREPDGSAFAKSLVSRTLGPKKYIEVTELQFPPGCRTDDIEFVMARMRHLNSVIFDHSDLSPKTIRNVSLNSLKSASLRYCDLSDIEIGQLQGARIDSLYLTGNPITDKSVETLATLAGARQLFLRWTDMTAEGIASLRNRLPDCEIHFHE